MSGGNSILQEKGNEGKEEYIIIFSTEYLIHLVFVQEYSLKFILRTD